MKICEETGGQKEGKRKWDWQEQRRGWNERGVTHRGERETERGRCREMERVGGRNKLKERNREESEAVGSFLSRILSLWLSGAFPPLEKLSLFLPFLVFSSPSIPP